MDDRTTVLVVGAGATGAGVARDLALRGVDVTLVDRAGVGSGTSGRSHGLLHSGARYAEADGPEARECLEESRIVRRIAGACVRETGGYFLQLADDDPAYFDAKREACEDVGIPTDVADGETARERVPGLAEDVERAMWVPDAVVLPSRLVAANVADAREHGARVLTHAPVDEITVETGQTEGGRTDGGRTERGRIEAVTLGGAVDERIEPAYVVNATGPYAARVAKLAGLTVEMRPTRGVVVSVAYDGLGPVLNRCRAPDDGDIVVPHEVEVVLGTTSVPVDDPDDFERPEWEVERTIEECARVLPAVASAPVTRRWWGVRPLYEPDEAARGGRGISRGFFLLDHADEGVENCCSVVGGKLTTYRRMAEVTADLVCDRLGVDASSQTADRQLPGADDPATLDGFVERFDGQGQSDLDIVGR